MFKREIQTVTTVAVCSVVIAVAAVIAVRVVSKSRRKKGHIIPRKVRKDIIEALEAAGAESHPTGKVGESIMRHKLENMSDKQLISIYAAMKVAKKAKEEGFDPVSATKDQIDHFRARYDKAVEESESRDSILKHIFSQDMSEVNPLLSFALGLIS